MLVLGASCALCAVGFIATVSGCASRPGRTSPASEPVIVGAPARSRPSAPAPAEAPLPRAFPPEEEGELLAGRRTFRGMVKPTKGGFEVRGVVLDGSALPDALAKSALDGTPRDARWFLGAVVRVTAELTTHESESMKDDLAVQTRSGGWTSAIRVDAAELVHAAETIEGVVQRSKGLFQVGGYLVRRDDLGWSLAGSGGGNEGDRVKLWGQPRIVHCNPGEQCLEGGSLPFFDVGRAEKLP